MRLSHNGYLAQVTLAVARNAPKRVRSVGPPLIGSGD